ncbi:MAG: signal peptide peptidase SppA [SAR324 cluster bacterium]|nr:signal peptide peptidase SppA [SAR324 cluster bacterium]
MLKKHPFISSTLILFVLLLVFSALLNLTQVQRISFLKEGVVGVIKIKGIILDPDPVVAQIRKMEQTHSVRGVIVRLDSPGGGVAASQEIYDALNELRKMKPVYTSMGAVAASGAYYIACASDRIFANPGTITGSIGVLLQWFNLEELGKKIGAEAITITSVPNKDLMSMFHGLENSQRVILQELVNDTHEQFIQAILKGREQLLEDQVRAVADGRVVVGNRAAAMGLVDELGSFSQVIWSLGKKLNLQEPIQTIEFDSTSFSLISLLGLAPLKEILPDPTGIRLSYLLQ